MSINVSQNANRLAYMGVEAPTPPNLVESILSPTTADGYNMIIGTLWIRRQAHVIPEELWMLVNQIGTKATLDYIGTWIQLFPGAGANFTFTTQGGSPVTFIANNLNVFGGTNITTTSIFGAGDTITINLNDNVALAGTLQVGSLGAGVVFSDATGNLSSSNGTNGQVIIGGGAIPIWNTITSGDGSITFTPGANTLDMVVAAAGLSIVHTNAGDANQVANAISIVGANVITTTGAGSTVTVKATNGTNGQLIIGGGANPAWANLTSIGATVAISVGPNTLNLEVAGAGSGAITFHTDAADATVVGAAITIAGANVITTSGAGSTVTVKATNGTNGQVIIGGGANPAWATLISSDASITFVTGANTLDLKSSGTGLNTVHTDGGNATVAAGAITVHGGTNITTSGAGSTVTVDLDNSISLSGSLTVSSLGSGVVQTTAGGLFFSDKGTDGQVLISSSTGVPIWANITGVNIAVLNGHNSIQLTGTGGGGGGGTENYITNSGTATETSGNIHVYGDGIFPLGNVQTFADSTTTPGFPPFDTVVVRLNQSLEFPMSNGQTGAGSVGQYWIGGQRYMHMFGLNTANANTWLGRNSGNLLLTTSTAFNNTGIGSNALNSLTTGASNTGIGNRVANAITTGSSNVAAGFNAMNNTTTGSNNVSIGVSSLAANIGGSSNIAIGTSAAATMTGGIGNIAIGNSAGNSWNSGETSNIAIDHTGVAGQSQAIHIGTAQTITNIAGIYNRSVGATNAMVFIDSTNKLGTLAGGTNGQVPIAATGGNVKLATITSSDGSIVITPGANTLDLKTYVVAFNARLAANVVNVTGDGSVYTFGSTQAFTQVYNVGAGGLILGGAGTNLSFQAPVNGVYRFQVNCLLGDLIAPPPPTPVPNPVCPLMLMVRNNPASVPNVRTYALIGSFWYPQISDPDFPQVMNYFWSADISLTAGQYVVAAISVTYGAGTKTLDLKATTTVPLFYGTVEGTFFSGSLLARQ